MGAETELWIALGYCLFMWLLSYLFKRYPPKSINHLYGYRTPRSMVNADTWKFANDFATRFMYRLSVYCLLLPAVGYVLWPDVNILATLTLHSVLLLSILWFTERELKKHFDQKGNRL